MFFTKIRVTTRLTFDSQDQNEKYFKNIKGGGDFVMLTRLEWEYLGACGSRSRRGNDGELIGGGGVL
jgi:hypothetical protein